MGHRDTETGDVIRLLVSRVGFYVGTLRLRVRRRLPCVLFPLCSAFFHVTQAYPERRRVWRDRTPVLRLASLSGSLSLSPLGKCRARLLRSCKRAGGPRRAPPALSYCRPGSGTRPGPARPVASAARQGEGRLEMLFFCARRCRCFAATFGCTAQHRRKFDGKRDTHRYGE